MKDNILTIFALHTCNKQKLHVTINNISKFINNSRQIVCVDSIEHKNSGLKEKLYQIDPKIKLYYIKNSEKLLDLSKWIYALKIINYQNYKFVILVNDSIYISQYLTNFYNMLKKYNSEMYGIIDCYIINKHIQSFLRAFNKEGIRKFVKYYEDNKNLVLKPQDVIYIFEIGIMKIFPKNKSLYSLKKVLNKTSIKYKLITRIKYLYNFIFNPQYKYFRTKKFLNLHFNDLLYDKFLNKYHYPILKIRKINTTSYPLFIYLKTVLLRFKFIPIKLILPKDFNPYIYKNLHWDLKNYSDRKASIHFIKYGIKEGKLYKKNQKISPPKYIRTYIKNKKINNLLN